MFAVQSAETEPGIAVGWFLTGMIPPNIHVVKLPIPEGRFHIGRRPDVNLCLPVPSVSKVHAEFVAMEFGLFVRDLGSTNGTFVNGRRVTEDTFIEDGDVVQFAEFEFFVGRTQIADSTKTQICDSADWMKTLTQFHRLMSNRAVVPHFQPIICFADQKTIGYEVLARSGLPGLKNPREMFETAERMGLSTKLSVLCREIGVEVGRQISGNAAMFLNTHPSEGPETGLLDSLSKLRTMAPGQPMVLELHEAAMTKPRVIADLRRELKNLNIELAYDDFGAGQSRLQELAEVPPDYLKFDISLIREIHLSSQRQQLVASLVRIALDLNIKPLAEGIETEAEARVCRDIGFTHAQGYFYGKPASVDSYPSR